jgi:hypothetical protein
LVVTNLNDHFTDLFIKKKKDAHKRSLDNEIKRKEDLEIIRLEEIERKKEEKIKRKEEQIRHKRENELKALKNLIQQELINNMEMNDDPAEICDIANFHTKAKKAGKFIHQIKIFILY